ncbi:MAG: carboxypeptidase-like regulatory domain-containing protein [Verrucomicrobia bacterium]|nr:carboxypeptidase-like regulatory domain-containing protein [Prolixibacteraceae bacterium]
MKKIILGILIAILSMVILGYMITVVSIAAFAGANDTTSEIKTEAKTGAAVVSLSGHVIDEVSGEALVGVEIKVEGSDKKAYTDFDGHFVISNIKAGQCKLVTSYTSYTKNEKTLLVNSKTNQVKIELQASK